MLLTKALTFECFHINKKVTPLLITAFSTLEYQVKSYVLIPLAPYEIYFPSDELVFAR